MKRKKERGNIPPLSFFSFSFFLLQPKHNEKRRCQNNSRNQQRQKRRVLWRSSNQARWICTIVRTIVTQASIVDILASKECRELQTRVAAQTNCHDLCQIQADAAVIVGADRWHRTAKCLVCLSSRCSDIAAKGLGDIEASCFVHCDDFCSLRLEPLLVVDVGERSTLAPGVSIVVAAVFAADGLLCLCIVLCIVAFKRVLAHNYGKREGEGGKGIEFCFFSRKCLVLCIKMCAVLRTPSAKLWAHRGKGEGGGGNYFLFFPIFRGERERKKKQEREKGEWEI